MEKIDIRNVDKWFPDPNREEWRKIVNGEIKHIFKNYVLQLKSYQISNEIKKKTKDEAQGILELQELCRKYALAVYEDFKIIFGI